MRRTSENTNREVITSVSDDTEREVTEQNQY